MQTTVLTVSGMTCGGCVKGLTTKLQALAGVEQVAIELASGRVEVTHAESVEQKSLVSCIENAGFDVVS